MCDVTNVRGAHSVAVAELAALREQYARYRRFRAIEVESLEARLREALQRVGADAAAGDDGGGARRSCAARCSRDRHRHAPARTCVHVHACTRTCPACFVPPTEARQLPARRHLAAAPRPAGPRRRSGRGRRPPPARHPRRQPRIWDLTACCLPPRRSQTPSSRTRSR
jgi:hypothetical protein